MARLLTLLLIIAFVPVTAQITIKNSNMPKSGDTIRYSTAIMLGKTGTDTTGPNMHWDFTDITATSQSLSEYKASYLTPYILNFGFSAVGLLLADSLGASDFQLTNMYNFYRTTSSTYTDVGLGFQFGAFPLPQAGKHSDPDEIYTFPLDYGDVDSTTYDLKVPIKLAIITVGNFYRTGNRVNTVDGWGTISTPYAKDVDCIRVKSVITGFDSIEVTTLSLAFGIPSTRIEYKWLSTTERIPMLTVSGTEVLGNFIPSTIQFRDDYRAIGPPDNITVDFDADKTFGGTGEVFTFINKSDGINLSYNWNINPSSSAIFVNGTSATSENPKIIFNANGRYTVQLIASGRNSSDTMTKDEYISIGSSRLLPEPITPCNSVYPNPADKHLTIRFDDYEAQREVRIFSTDGRMVFSTIVTDYDLINIEDLAVGPYIVSIFDKNNRRVHQSLIVVKRD